MEPISTRIFSLRTPLAQIRRARFIVSSPPSLVIMGSRQPQRRRGRKKRHKTKRKNLSHHSETEQHTRTKLDRLWRYLSGETPKRLQSPFLCVDVRLDVRLSDGNVRANFLFGVSSLLREQSLGPVL